MNGTCSYCLAECEVAWAALPFLTFNIYVYIGHLDMHETYVLHLTVTH